MSPSSRIRTARWEGANVLIQRLTLTEAAAHFQRPLENMEHRLADDRSVLLARRGLRPRPHLDDKILTAWNGLMIGAFARASRVLGVESYLFNAQRAATFIRKNLFDASKGELLRSYREGPSNVHGFASDYAFLIGGLLDLYKTDFDLEWLKWARQLQDTLDLHFWDQEHGGYFSTSDKDPAILLRMKEDYDGAEPTPNSVAVRNLWRMGRLFNNDVLLEHARHAVRALASRIEAHPFAMPFLLVSAAMLKLPADSPDYPQPEPDASGAGAFVGGSAPLLPDPDDPDFDRRQGLTRLLRRAPTTITSICPAQAVAEPTAYLCEELRQPVAGHADRTCCAKLIACAVPFSKRRPRLLAWLCPIGILSHPALVGGQGRRLIARIGRSRSGRLTGCRGSHGWCPS